MSPQFDLEKLAKLAQIDLRDMERDTLSKELERILEFMSSLEAVDTSNVPPLFHPNNESLPLRDDEVKEGLDRKMVEQTLSERENSYLRVPKVME